MFKLIKADAKDAKNNIELTNYLVSADWSGDLDQAGRKLDFVLAYTSAKKNKVWENPVVNLGDTVQLVYIDDKQQQYTLFAGRVFMYSHNTTDYTMEFVAYDALISLAKNKLVKKFKDITIRSVIEQVANECGLQIGTVCNGLDRRVSFIADGQTGTEAIKKALEFAHIFNGKDYHILLKDGKVCVVDCDEVIESYQISDDTNLIACSHSESIEDLVNTVIICNKQGEPIGTVTNDADINSYGKFQDIYRQDEKQDTNLSARALLKTVAMDSSFEGVGNIQVISGCSVDIDDEQVKGRYLIKSDSHKIGENKHTMHLTIAYRQAINASNTMPKTNGNVSAGLMAGGNAWVGSRMSNGSHGCCEAVTKVGSYYSPFLAREANNGVVNNDILIADAKANNIAVIPYDASQVGAGDVIVYGDDNGHSVIADGRGGYYGNSSSGNLVVHKSDYTKMGGLKPTRIIKTGSN